MTKATFDKKQLSYLAKGEKLAKLLDTKARQALGIIPGYSHPKDNHYIYSPPGIGKTHSISNLIELYKVPVLKIHGATSMNALVTQLATCIHMRPNTQIVVWVDDCDMLFEKTENMNVMKGAMDDRRILAWNKNLSSQIAGFENSDSRSEQAKGAALRYFQPIGSVGVEIPTNNLRFLVTSNKNLTPPNRPKKNEKESMEGTLRDRMEYTEFALDAEASWGWAAHMLLSHSVVNITVRQKNILLNWMWDNWANLNATSLRAIKDLGHDMINHPVEYLEHWQMRLSGGVRV